MSLNIAIFAGESSGDQLAQALISTYTQRAITWHGMAGPKAKSAGCDITIPINGINVMGWLDACKASHQLIKTYQSAKRCLDARPDAIVLIDFPGFNLRIAAMAKNLKIPVFYINPPQIWAWGKHRMAQIKHHCDQLALLLPFEQEIYRDAAIHHDLIKHPLLDYMSPNQNKKSWRLKQGYDPFKTYICCMPGSRPNEIKRLAKIHGRILRNLIALHPHVEVIIPVADGIDPSMVSNLMALDGINHHLITHDRHLAMSACDIALVSCGTAALETTLLSLPTAIVYRLDSLSYRLAKKKVNIDYIGLPNLICKKLIAKEWLQDQIDTQTIALHLLELINNYDAAKQRVQLVARTLEQANHRPLHICFEHFIMRSGLALNEHALDVNE